MNRREFIVSGGAALLAAGTVRGEDGAGAHGRMLFGACRPPKDAALLKSIGFDFYEHSASASFDPTKDEEWWKGRRDEILGAALPLRSCIGFLPASFRITGENADFAPILEYASTMCRRADEVGLKTIVFGSAGARNVPVVYSGGWITYPGGFDMARGREQFVEFCSLLGRRLEEEGRKVTVVIEPLRPNETNLVNYVWQGMQIVDEVKSPRVQLLADLFHMSMGREPADSIVKAGRRLMHCHVASYKTRLFPGSDSDGVSRLKPYFDALKAIGYAGGVSCECGWGDGADFAKNLETALTTLKELAK